MEVGRDKKVEEGKKKICMYVAKLTVKAALDVHSLSFLACHEGRRNF